MDEEYINVFLKKEKDFANFEANDEVVREVKRLIRGDSNFGGSNITIDKLYFVLKRHPDLSFRIKTFLQYHESQFIRICKDL